MKNKKRIQSAIRELFLIIICVAGGVGITAIVSYPSSLQFNLDPDINRHLDNRDCGCGGCSINYPLPKTGSLL